MPDRNNVPTVPIPTTPLLTEPPDADAVRALVTVESTTCARCGDTVETSTTIRTVAGSTICPPCRDLFYWCCDVCSGWNRDGNTCGNDCALVDEDDDYDDDDDALPGCGGLVRDYGYKPSPVFHGSGPLFLGLELEVATPRRVAYECARTASARLAGLGYLKSDESIGGGFEIVTHPMAYPWALAHFPWRLLPALEVIGAAGPPAGRP